MIELVALLLAADVAEAADSIRIFMKDLSTLDLPVAKVDSIVFIHHDSVKADALGLISVPGVDYKTQTAGGVGFRMAKVGAGKFWMGSQFNDKTEVNYDYYAFSDEAPVHRVTLTESYWIGQTEVTQALWRAVMGNDDTRKCNNPAFPMFNVSWYDCLDFCNKLSQMEGLTPYYNLTSEKYATSEDSFCYMVRAKVTTNELADGFRLPTEAQWEFAARGQYKSKEFIYAGSDSVNKVMWYAVNSGKCVHVVAQLSPNELGLYDMCGNVLEWSQDFNASYSAEACIDPEGPASGYERVARGGGYGSSLHYCSIACRQKGYPEKAYSDCGFRIVCPAR